MHYILIAALAALDQTVKYLVRANMKPGETIPVIENILHITYVRNDGGAFSILQGHTVLLTVIPAALILAVLTYIHRNRGDCGACLMAALSMICAGGIGNLIDRVRFSAVVDFIDFRVFPVFNVADVCVCCGCGLILVGMLFSGKRPGEGGEAGSDG